MNDSYEDWYDNGPGSESFKRKIREREQQYYKEHELVIFPEGGIGFRRKKKEEPEDDKKFIDHLEECSKKVSQWPKWKREILGHIKKQKYTGQKDDKK